MELTVVGSGTAAPDPERACAGFFIEHGATTLLLDCGPGVVHHLARFGLPWERLDHLAITHFHTDHIGDIPALLFALRHGTPEPRERPLTVWGPVGVRERMHALAGAFGDYVIDPGFPLEIVELDGGAPAAAGDLRLTAHPTPHTAESCAYRVEPADGPASAGARPIGYTGDTDGSDDLAAFMADVHVLIAECSAPDDEPVAGHLSPSTLAELARGAAPALLVVTHVYPKLGARDVLGAIQQAGWDGEAMRARDGLRLRVPPAG